MTSRDIHSVEDPPPRCETMSCPRTAEFVMYRAAECQWIPTCGRHLVEVHPSLERKAWLESGFAKPMELGWPDAPPSTPSTPRAVAFRRLVEDAMGWRE